MMIDKTFTFRRLFYKKLHYIQVFDFDMNGQSGSGTLLQLPASASTSLLLTKDALHAAD